MLEPQAICVKQDSSSWVVKRLKTRLVYKIKYHHVVYVKLVPIIESKRD